MPNQRTEPPRTTRPLVALGVLLVAMTVWIALAARPFAYETVAGEGYARIPGMLALFGLAFVVYGFAIVVATRLPDRSSWPIVLTVAIVTRLVLVFSTPILEVDVYRYLWDGIAINVGVDPFRYAPDDVSQADASQPMPADLRRLVDVRNRCRPRATILARVHYPRLTTVYPPVSQVVFAAAMLVTPASSSPFVHLVVMKAFIVAFDMGTLLVVASLLRFVRMPLGWAVAYGWCPLVLKEFANSGHLDAIAVLFTVLGVRWLLSAVCGERRSLTGFCAAAAVLALGVGAKLFPIVLGPLVLCLGVRCFGWRRGWRPAAVLVGLSAILLAPMLVPRASRPTGVTNRVAATNEPANATAEPLPPQPEEAAEEHASLPGSRAGLTVFLTTWEMNDLVFQFVADNLRPDDALLGERTGWFVFVPNSWRSALANALATTGWSRQRGPFLLARLVLGLAFAVWAMLLASRCSDSRNVTEVTTDATGRDPRFATRVLEAVFLTLAWFWFTSPTQNPWYWIWALPFVAFARRRAWLAVSGLTMLYYTRFWLNAFGPPALLTALHAWLPFTTGWDWLAVPFRLTAGDFFFQIVVWLEFGPFLLWVWAARPGRDHVHQMCPSGGGSTLRDSSV